MTGATRSLLGWTFALLLLLAGLWGSYMLTRIGDADHHARMTADLLRLKQADTALEVNVVKATAFRLPHYDAFLPILDDFRSLEAEVRRLAATVEEGPSRAALDRAIDRYFEGISRKRALTEHIKARSARVLNSLRFVRTSIYEISETADDALIRPFHLLLDRLLDSHVFPDAPTDESDPEILVRRIRSNAQSDPQIAARIEPVLAHVGPVLDQNRLIRRDMTAFQNVGTMALLDDVHAALSRLNAERARLARLYRVFVLAVASGLAIALVVFLVRLHLAHSRAERASARLSDAIESIPAAFSLFDASDRLVLWNRKFLEFYQTLIGRPLRGRTYREIMDEAVSQRQFGGDAPPAKALEDLLSSHIAEGPATLQKLRDGRELLSLDSATSEGGMASVLVDVTDDRRNREQLRKLSLAVEQSPASVIITDRKGLIEYVNPSFVRATGYSAGEVIGRNPRILKSGYTSGAEYAEMWRAISEGRIWRGELHNRRKNGELFWESAMITAIRDEDGEVGHFLAVKEDITQRKHQEALLFRQARYDSLTDLPNRSMTFENLQNAIALAQRNKRRLAIMFLDLDNFKTINETISHAAGDELLIRAAERFSECVRDSDQVSRLGGDEFAILLPEIRNRDEAAVLARRLLAAFEPPFDIQGHLHHSTVSIGIALFPEDGFEASGLMRNADAALFRVKETGRNNFEFFNEQIEAQLAERRRLESFLFGALERGEFDVHYQPVVDIASGRVIKTEALCRWTCPDIGPVSPAVFIPIAEERGLIDSIGAWTLRAACQQAKLWLDGDFGFEQMAVNISTRQLKSGVDLPGTVSRILDETGLPPAHLELEVTESLLVDNFADASAALGKLKDMGIRIAIDDFGTGYSSLAYLKRFHFDTLKIDRSFVRDMADNEESLTLVHSLISMAHALDLLVVAEGVEEEGHLHHLRMFGCDRAQGYLSGRPMPAGDLTRLLRSGGK